MPAKPRWLLHIPEIIDQLRALDVPIVDRAMCERLFGLRRRRTIELIQHFGGYRSANSLLVDRLALIEQLETIKASPEVAAERQRKERLEQRLVALSRYRRATQVRIPVTPAAERSRLPELPAGVALETGRLLVEFSRTEDLLQRLYAVAQAAANDFEAFEQTVDRHSRPAA